MYQKMANFVAGILLKNEEADNDRRDICAFGLELIIAQIFGIAFLGITALLLGAIVEAVIYYVVFMIVRKYAGGYHATTYTRCNVLYLLSFALAVFAARAMTPVWLPVLLAFSAGTVVLLAPIENPNNPIKRGMWRRYTLYSVLISLGLSGAVATLYFFDISIYRISAVTMAMAAIYMYVEIIKRRVNIMTNLKNRICKFVAEKAEAKAQSSRREVSENRIHQPKAPAALLKLDK